MFHRISKDIFQLHYILSNLAIWQSLFSMTMCSWQKLRESLFQSLLVKQKKKKNSAEYPAPKANSNLARLVQRVSVRNIYNLLSLQIFWRYNILCICFWLQLSKFCSVQQLTDWPDCLLYQIRQFYISIKETEDICDISLIAFRLMKI